MRNKLFQLNTMAKKNTLILVCVSLILLVLLSSVAPSLFYAITKNYLTNYAASAVGECSVRMSYILTQHRPAYVLPWNKDAVAALGNTLTEKSHMKAANERLRNNLPVTVEGKPSSGNSHIISCINYSVLSTDRGDVFCSEWAKEIAESFVNSGFTDTVPEGSDPVYSVITLNVGGNDVDFLCFTTVFSVAGRVCYRHYADRIF